MRFDLISIGTIGTRLTPLTVSIPGLETKKIIFSNYQGSVTTEVLYRGEVDELALEYARKYLDGWKSALYALLNADPAIQNRILQGK